eukprot:TRINITY_DN8598_c0_g1_i1.p1 TRINITY_DN8598_c0_g1~~TRINITY_DN8598_c0_g1_i1.p1  ORF type:complete len:229 (+),score=0.86 TRINITY_DN8598_c0_g1_i1:262-948(+)
MHRVFTPVDPRFRMGWANILMIISPLLLQGISIYVITISTEIFPNFCAQLSQYGFILTLIWAFTKYYQDLCGTMVMIFGVSLSLLTSLLSISSTYVFLKYTTFPAIALATIVAVHFVYYYDLVRDYRKFKVLYFERRQKSGAELVKPQTYSNEDVIQALQSRSQLQELRHREITITHSSSNSSFTIASSLDVQCENWRRESFGLLQWSILVVSIYTNNWSMILRVLMN